MDLAKQAQESVLRVKPTQLNEQILVPDAHAWLGILAAKDKNEATDRAERKAVLALLSLRAIRSNEPKLYGVFHNLACIYGELAKRHGQNTERRDMYETMAIRFIHEAAKAARARGQLAREQDAVDNETSFSARLKGLAREAMRDGTES